MSNKSFNDNGYSNRSNANRAIKSLGLPGFKYAIDKDNDGKFYVRIDVIASAAPAPKAAPLANRKARAKAAAQVAPLTAEQRKGLHTDKGSQASTGALPFPKALEEGGCPHCGDTQNGCTENHPANRADKVNDYLDCHMCGATFHKQTGALKPERKAGARKAATRTTKNPGGYHIEKKRETRNGVTRYSDGTLGAKVWAILDKVAAKLPGGIKDLTAQMAKDACVPEGINPTQAGIEFYCWRRFNGIRGRINLKKAQPKPAKAAK